MENRAARIDGAREARRQRGRRKRLVITFGVAAALAAATGVYLGYSSHRSSEELTAERLRRSEEASGSVVDELLSDPAVQEMLQGERAEAAAARDGR